MSVIGNDLDEDVYIGIGLPLNYGDAGFFKRTTTSLEQAKHNIKNLLLTKKGERLGNPTFGSDLFAILFEQEGDDLESKVEEAVRSAMSEFLPFINVNAIRTVFSSSNRNIINVSMQFSLNVDSSSSDELSLDINNY